MVDSINLGKISKTNIDDKKLKIIGYIMLFTSYVITWIILYRYISIQSLKTIVFQIVTAPISIILLTLVHEAIHILLLYLFSLGEAKIKICRDKESKYLIVQQLNSNVSYKKYQFIIILLGPLIIINLITLLLMPNNYFIYSMLLIMLNS